MPGIKRRPVEAMVTLSRSVAAATTAAFRRTERDLAEEIAGLILRSRGEEECFRRTGICVKNTKAHSPSILPLAQIDALVEIC